MNGTRPWTETSTIEGAKSSVHTHATSGYVDTFFVVVVAVDLTAAVDRRG